ncbi:NAD-dependent epimerase/dehydratase family protein [Rhizobium leucaenae]|uniref:NAD-dependent epimerase/dehydratase family protein n=1 Tax=Rhizobium leucaenae TaxID=29450 RepID=UPI00161E2A66|nr:NAD-dependent epimerase/dehydratase family protein [Rhizobium leucaenae]MBB6301315.1 nucleoside-diphosphate-sugar epimerase [Rhizobium leucaenae]
MELKTALVLGVTGGIGGEIARALIGRGWLVRALHRDPSRVAQPVAGIRWIKGDAMDLGRVLAAARGTSLIVHGVNPPAYRGWARLVLPMLDNSIAAAKVCGARIFFPGTVYNFGREAFPLIAEDAPQHPRSRKGLIRVEMERRLRMASEAGVPVLIVRCGDWFGPVTTGNSWFRAALVRPGRPVRAIVYPGRRDVGHSWAYLPDVAEAVMQLIERQHQLELFTTFHFGGHWFERGVEIAEEIRAAAGNLDLPIRRFPWWLIRAGSPFMETFREMLEVEYLWREPVRLDNRKLVQFLGIEPHTPVHDAVSATLQGMQCLPSRADSRGSCAA